MYSQDIAVSFIIQTIKWLFYMVYFVSLVNNEKGYSLSATIHLYQRWCVHINHVSKVTFSRLGVTMHITWAKPSRNPHKVNVLLQMTISVSLLECRQGNSGCKCGTETHLNLTHLNLQHWNKYSYKYIL